MSMKRVIAVAGWIERNKWILIAVLVCATALTIAYIMRPARYHVMGEHNSYIFDIHTGEAFYANGKPVKPPPQKNKAPSGSDYEYFSKALEDKK